MNALLRNDEPLPNLGAEFLRVLKELLGDHPKKPRIRCPRCEWQPSKNSRWSCVKECDCSWNTFDTHGKCPRCRRQWRVTACLKCSRYSPHEDWYEKEEPKP